VTPAQYGAPPLAVATSHGGVPAGSGDRPTGDGEREETEMAYGEAEQGRAEGEHCLLGDQEQQAGPGHGGKNVRRLCGAGPQLVDGVPAVVEGVPAVVEGVPAAPGPDRLDGDGRAISVPRQRLGEPDGGDEPQPPPGPACRTDRPGWAGAHRHGAVRPRQRANRRERPPRRWC
jgi:hypothetical protein